MPGRRCSIVANRPTQGDSGNSRRRKHSIRQVGFDKSVLYVGHGRRSGSVMDKAVNFVLHTERFDGQLLFNPRLALGQGTISSALPSLRSLLRREHSGRKDSRLDFIVMLLNDSLTEGPYPTLPPPSLVHMSHHDRTTSMNTFPLLSPRAFWISSAWSITLVLFALFLLEPARTNRTGMPLKSRSRN